MRKAEEVWQGGLVTLAASASRLPLESNWFGSDGRKAACYSVLADSCVRADHSPRRSSVRTENQLRIFADIVLRFGRLALDLPVVMIAQKMLLVPIIKCCFQEQPSHADVAHFLEAPVGGVHAAADDGKFAPCYLLA